MSRVEFEKDEFVARPIPSRPAPRSTGSATRSIPGMPVHELGFSAKGCGLSAAGFGLGNDVGSRAVRSVSSTPSRTSSSRLRVDRGSLRGASDLRVSPAASPWRGPFIRSTSAASLGAVESEQVCRRGSRRQVARLIDRWATTIRVIDLACRQELFSGPTDRERYERVTAILPRPMLVIFPTFISSAATRVLAKGVIRPANSHVPRIPLMSCVVRPPVGSDVPRFQVFR